MPRYNVNNPTHNTIMTIYVDLWLLLCIKPTEHHKPDDNLYNLYADLKQGNKCEPCEKSLWLPKEDNVGKCPLYQLWSRGPWSRMALRLSVILISWARRCIDLSLSLSLWAKYEAVTQILMTMGKGRHLTIGNPLGTIREGHFSNKGKQTDNRVKPRTIGHPFVPRSIGDRSE